jgi:hypothetical protein
MRREALVPIDDELERELGEQRQRVRDRWPAGTPVLSPQPTAIPDGQRCMVDQTYRRALRRWLERCDVRDAAGGAVTFEIVAKTAGVSRSWLYTQPDIRAEIERLRSRHQRAPAQPVPARQRTTDPSLLQRLEIANARNRELAEDNQRLRRQLAQALGELRAAGRTRFAAE